jgi:aryl-alcohol dehydrogenase-like predicted oxidoreductase
MEQRQLGKLFPVSALTLGGGGIGQVWGDTTREESIETVRAAYEGGITLFDMAPLYGRGEAETVLGLAFGDGYPDDVRVTTKCMLGTVAADEVLPRLLKSLEGSCERMRRSWIDLFVLHGYVVPDGFVGGRRADVLNRIAVPWSLYQGSVVPAMRRLVEKGLIGAWGLTAAGPQETNLAVLDRRLDPLDAPGAVQCITNLLDSPGGMAITREPPRPREVIARAHARGVGVMGIRAVAAGALTDKLDRKLDESSAEFKDFTRASRFRELAREVGETAASLAHRYSLGIEGVDTVVLGVKNRRELEECLAAEAAGALGSALVEGIDALLS